MDQTLSDLLALDMTVWEKIIRTIGVYLLLLVLIRVFGKRLMAQMNSQDLVVVLLLSNVVQNAVIGSDTTLVGGAIGAIVLVLANGALDWASARVAWLDTLVNGRATTVVTDGALDRGALQRLSITPHELDVALHEQGADSVGSVHRTTIEPGGAILVEIDQDHQAVSRQELAETIEHLQAHIDRCFEQLRKERA